LLPGVVTPLFNELANSFLVGFTHVEADDGRLRFGDMFATRQSPD